jgi:hypothetical protein
MKRVAGKNVLLVASVVALACSCTSIQRDRQREKNTMIVAHRGASKMAPENTLPALMIIGWTNLLSPLVSPLGHHSSGRKMNRQKNEHRTGEGKAINRLSPLGQLVSPLGHHSSGRKMNRQKNEHRTGEGKAINRLSPLGPP